MKQVGMGKTKGGSGEARSAMPLLFSGPEGSGQDSFLFSNSQLSGEGAPWSGGSSVWSRLRAPAALGQKGEHMTPLPLGTSVTFTPTPLPGQSLSPALPLDLPPPPCLPAPQAPVFSAAAPANGGCPPSLSRRSKPVSHRECLFWLPLPSRGCGPSFPSSPKPGAQGAPPRQGLWRRGRGREAVGETREAPLPQGHEEGASRTPPDATESVSRPGSCPRGGN